MEDYMKLNLLVCAAVLCVIALPAAAEKKGKIQSAVKEGKYIESDLLSTAKLPYLPIPNTKDDYAFLQSIGKSTSVVVGRFSDGEKQIIFISDMNGDGKVDVSSTYYPDLKKFRNSTQPDKDYPSDRFKKMKEDIIRGAKGELNPNSEGADFVKRIAEKKNNIVMKVRFKNGFRVFVNDADDANLHRGIFYFSDNRKSEGGVDLAFKVEFHNVGPLMVSPIINYGVFCKDSLDASVIDVVTDLSQHTSKFFGE
jgi:hypothetical protein